MVQDEVRVGWQPRFCESGRNDSVDNRMGWQAWVGYTVDVA